MTSYLVRKRVSSARKSPPIATKKTKIETSSLFFAHILNTAYAAHYFFPYLTDTDAIHLSVTEQSITNYFRENRFPLRHIVDVNDSKVIQAYYQTQLMFVIVNAVCYDILPRPAFRPYLESLKIKIGSEKKMFRFRNDCHAKCLKHLTISYLPTKLTESHMKTSYFRELVSLIIRPTNFCSIVHEFSSHFFPNTLQSININTNIVYTFEVDTFPPSLTELILAGDCRNHSIISFPPALTKLELGYCVSMILFANPYAVVFPQILQHLTIYWDDNLVNVTFPNSLTHLHISFSHTSHLQNPLLQFPIGLKYLYFQQRLPHFSLSCLPVSLNELVVYGSDTFSGTLPPNIEKLTLLRIRYAFEFALPPSLHTLDIDSINFVTKRRAKWIWPQTLTDLTMRNTYDTVTRLGPYHLLIPSLKRLTLTNNYLVTPHSLPDSLEYLEMKNSSFINLSSSKILPPNLKELVYWRHTIDLEIQNSMFFPVSLTNITICDSYGFFQYPPVKRFCVHNVSEWNEFIKKSAIPR